MKKNIIFCIDVSVIGYMGNFSFKQKNNLQCYMCESYNIGCKKGDNLSPNICHLVRSLFWNINWVRSLFWNVFLRNKEHTNCEKIKSFTINERFFSSFIIFFCTGVLRNDSKIFDKTAIQTFFLKSGNQSLSASTVSKIVFTQYSPLAQMEIIAETWKMCKNWQKLKRNIKIVQILCGLGNGRIYYFKPVKENR